ncbi:hypothetical protein AMTR_s00114p00086930 [Amborella trichopoda]|uniref:Uncharacterized protein n=1 Tax=Amborella trichopoda TaxID=13333 RepID=W1NTR2_AMBTC|nr:hypothetical protein AMTR_s00114p00086930 [Amborella trichopoda]
MDAVERLITPIVYCDSLGLLLAFFTLRWVPPVIRVDYEVEYLSYMAPLSAEWEERHVVIYELSEEDAMVPLMVYGERYQAFTWEIMYISMLALEIMERVGMGGPGEQVSLEAVHLRG